MRRRLWSCALLFILLPLYPANLAAEIVEARLDKHLAFPSGVVLRGLSAGQSIPFTVPPDRLLNAARVLLRFRHSPALIDPSTLTVGVNGTPLNTIRLTAQNADSGALEAAIPAALLKEYNRLEITAAQHYTTACEDPFESSLWTAVTVDSRLVFDFGGRKSFPRLNHFPRPLADVLDYREPAVRFVVPSGAAAAGYTAAERIAGAIGRHLEFKTASLEAAAALDLNAPADQVLIGTAAELSGIPEAASWLEPLPGSPGLGFLRLVENPRQPGRFVLVVSGRDAEGIRKAVAALVHHPEMQALSAATAVIERVEPGAAPAPRGFIPERDSFTLRDLGQGRLTVRGLNPAPFQIRLRAPADAHFVPYEQKIRLEFAYGPQVETTRSTLEVILNGTALHGRALSRATGSPSETLEVNVPPGLLGMENLLQLQFHLYPRNWNYCEKFDNDFLWATLFDSTRLDLPRDRWAELPELALLRHSGYPLSDGLTALVLPRAPQPAEATLLVNVAFLLGRIMGSAPGEVYFDSDLPAEVRRSSHLVLVGELGRHALLREITERLTFHTAEQKMRLGQAAQVRLGAGQASTDGIVEQAISPWNSERVLLVFSGRDAPALERTRQSLSNPELLPKFRGNLMLLHEDGKADSFALADTRHFGKVALNRRVKYFVMRNVAWFAVWSVVGLMFLFFLLRFLRRHFFRPSAPAEP